MKTISNAKWALYANNTLSFKSAGKQLVDFFKTLYSFIQHIDADELRKRYDNTRKGSFRAISPCITMFSLLVSKSYIYLQWKCIVFVAHTFNLEKSRKANKVMGYRPMFVNGEYSNIFYYNVFYVGRTSKHVIVTSVTPGRSKINILLFQERSTKARINLLHTHSHIRKFDLTICIAKFRQVNSFFQLSHLNLHCLQNLLTLSGIQQICRRRLWSDKNLKNLHKRRFNC